MLRILKYVNNVRALQFFQLIRTGALLLISIIFTKKNPFSGEEVLRLGEIGVYETFLIIAGSVSFFWVSGLMQSLLSVYNNNKTFNNQKENPILFNTFILFTIFGIIAALFVLSLEGSIARVIGGLPGNRIPYMKILFFYIMFSCPANLVEYIYFLKNKPFSILIYGIITFTLQLICVTAPILLKFDLGYGLYGLVFVNIIRYGWLAIIVYKYSAIKFSFPFIKEFIYISYPLVLSIFIGGSASYFDSFLVSYKFGEATLAIFRYGTKELPFISPFIIAFGNALTHKFTDTGRLRGPLLELKSGTTRLMHYFFPITFIILLTSKYLYPILFNEDFAKSAIVFNIYLLLIIIRFLFVQTIFVGLKETKIIFRASIFELLINIILSIILINFIGIEGVAAATVISYIVNKIYLIVYLKRKNNIKLSDYLDLKIYWLYVSCLLLCFIISFVF